MESPFKSPTRRGLAARLKLAGDEGNNKNSDGNFQPSVRHTRRGLLASLAQASESTLSSEEKSGIYSERVSEVYKLQSFNTVAGEQLHLIAISNVLDFWPLMLLHRLHIPIALSSVCCVVYCG